MRIEVTIAKTSPLPAGAIDALAGGHKKNHLQKKKKKKKTHRD
ncbi:hypothetical protein K795_10183, partial [Salmonella enterica subsp. enterica serovar Newport str. SHSN005]